MVAKFPECKLSAREVKWLGDFYYDARYPGDDFITVTFGDAQDAIRIGEDTIAEVAKILIDDESKQLFDYYNEQNSKFQEG